MFAKNYHLHWIASRANILSKFILYIFFHFGCGFCGSFLMLFPKAPASLNQFLLTCASIFMISNSVIFKILFHTGDTNIFVLRGVLFSRYVQLKGAFSDGKKQR